MDTPIHPRLDTIYTLGLTLKKRVCSRKCLGDRRLNTGYYIHTRFDLDEAGLELNTDTIYTLGLTSTGGLELNTDTIYTLGLTLDRRVRT